MRCPLFKPLLLALCLTTSFSRSAAWAEQAAPQDGSQREAARLAAIKAGMVVNFLRYTSWPASAFKDSGQRLAPIIITLAGDTGLAEALSDAVRDVRIDGREVEVRRVAFPLPHRGEAAPRQSDIDAYHATLADAHLVFFGHSEHTRFERALAALGPRDVLTVSDIQGFAPAGGMLELTIREKRVAFDANEEAVRATAVKLSSRLLKLARIVKPRSPAPARETPDTPREGSR